jgi:hypothetical protein
MAEQQTATCRACSQTISPEDTIVFGYGLLGHLDCRRPRVLSAEERTLLFIYCRDHQERKALGVVEDDVIRLDGFFAGRDAQDVENDVRASYALRERSWLEHLLGLDASPVLFVCGANHAESFRDRLCANGIEAHLLIRKWVPT